MKRMRRWGKWIGLGILLLAFGFYLAGILINRYCAATPPPIPAQSSILQAPIEQREGRTWCGRACP